MSFRVIRFAAYQSGPIRLIYSTEERRAITHGQVRIKVFAFALNQADILQAKGKYPPPPGESDIPGLELVGEVVESRHRHFKPGMKVMALVGSGAFAEECVVDGALLHALPSDFTTIEAAALPEALTTVHATVFNGAKPKQPQRILMHAATSGIGTLAAQMLALSGTEADLCGRNHQKMAVLPFYPHIRYHTVESPEDLREQHFEPFDRIIDMLGGAYTKVHLDLLKPKGHLLFMASLTGLKSELFLPTLMQKRLTLQGFVLRSQSTGEKAKLFHQACEHWLTFNKPPKPLIDRVFSFEDTEQALHRMANCEHIGKIVVKLSA